MVPLGTLVVLAALTGPTPLESRCLIPNVRPGQAKIEMEEAKPDHPEKEGSSYEITLSNSVLRVSWELGNTGANAPAIDNGFLENRMAGARISIGFPFEATTLDGTKLWPFGMKLKEKPKVEEIKALPGAAQLSARCHGHQVTATILDDAHHMQVVWKAILLDESNYVRQEVSFSSLSGDLPLKTIQLLRTDMPGAKVQGIVQGSPIASETFFGGLEHPMSDSKVDKDSATCSIERKLPLKPGVTVTYSSVIGVSPKGQLRRAFLNYLERERARPYAPFLHYNSWYDIGYFTPYNEADCLDSIQAFGKELSDARGVKLDSFLFDDGWDDKQTVWEFHKGFPNGFLPLKEAAAKYGAAPGIWLSPWGGYGPPRDQRLATGKAQGMEIDSEGYALSGPKYYERFNQVVLDLVNKYGINQFKLDGTGSPDKQVPGSAFASDFEAAIQLIKDLRVAKPSLFINLTTGTWPSPFWLRYADSIWRGGDDHSFAGVGTKRQQWITYRDSDTYAGIVQQGQLYPVTSLMLHGLIYAQHAHDLTNDPGNDFASEVHDYFGNGTQLQEMYISHKLLTPGNWDDLAEGAKWSRANADVLVDSHWIGGDPAKSQVYGWASWSPRKGILVLRNPSDKPQKISVDLMKMFQLPERHPGSFKMHSPWSVNAKDPVAKFDSEKPQDVTLKPFEVVVWDAVPGR